jgi:hypothetical protein
MKVKYKGEGLERYVTKDVPGQDDLLKTVFQL